MVNKKKKEEAQQELKWLKDELKRTTEKLLKRDMEFGKVVDKQKDQLHELDKSAKALVRRDMELHRVNDELRRIDQAKSHFVSVAAHQLRTPLSIIKWTFRMLLSGDFGEINEEQANVVQRGYDVNESMIKLVSALLDVARIESGRFVFRFADVSMEDIVNDVIGANAKTIEDRHVQIKIIKKFKGDVPVVSGDSKTLNIVLQNFIRNSLDYTLPGGEITIIYNKVGNKFLKISVKDTGIGVPKHQLPRLFSKFFRGDNVVRMQTSGTGLGLFIAQSIITAHNGTIGAESIEGRGSTFWFIIPIKKR